MTRKRRTALMHAAAFAVLAVAATGCSGDGATTVTPKVSAANAAEASLLPTAADALPTFDFAKFEDLGAQLNGVPVVVNIWSSWCGPCRTEAPELAAAAATYGSQVQFLGVDILDNRGDAASFIRQYHWSYPSLYNASGDIRDKLGFVGQPETLFYDSAGHVVSTWIGPITADQLDQHIAAITPGE